MHLLCVKSSQLCFPVPNKAPARPHQCDIYTLVKNHDPELKTPPSTLKSQGCLCLKLSRDDLSFQLLFFMIEIPNLEESGHSRQELRQIEQQYDAHSFEESPVKGVSATPISNEETQLYERDELHSPQGLDDTPLERPTLQQEREHQYESPETPHAPDIDSGTQAFLGPAFDYDHSQSPLVSAPQLVNTQSSPLPADQYFSSKYQRQVDHMTSEETIYENTDAFMIHPSSISSAFAKHGGASPIEEVPTISKKVAPQMTPVRLPRQRPSQPSHPLRKMVASSPDPDISSEANMGSVSDFRALDEFDTSGQSNRLPLSNSTTLPIAASSNFQTPQPLQSHNYIEPSPQLPPPLSAKASKLSFSHGDEFAQMRRVMATEQKTPAEYTLHIVFTQFVRHAERKLNMCLEYPLSNEPPILELLAHGVDPNFDNIVSALGYIAKRKSKPVIDSVMFWRKSKSEVAAMAASEVEKIYDVAQGDLARIATSTSMSKSSQNSLQSKTAKPPGKGKRSLSLMHTKSLSKLSHKRNNSASVVPTNSNGNRSSLDQETGTQSSEYTRQKKFYDEQIAQARDTAIQAERKSLASIYILCRVLIEVVKQASYEAVGDDLGEKLEEIVYTQLRTTDPVTTRESFVRSANWNLFAELLGYMSEKRFVSVSDRFIADLEKVPSSVKQTEEPNICLLIQGMKHLKLSNYPLEAFEESAEFLQSLTKFFSQSHNHVISIAYAKVISDLILPLATSLTAEANHPLWVETITKIFEKATVLCNHSSARLVNGATSSIPSMSSNEVAASANDWAIAVELMTSSLVVAPKELFADHWFKMIELNASKLKPKGDIADKTTLMVCASRLLWVYMNRLPDTLNNTMKRLENFFELVFFGPQVSGKKQWIVLDTNLINATSEVIRIVGFHHFNFVLENVILKLLKSSFNGSTLENCSPEKLILVIESYMLCLKDLKSGEKPKFPTDKVFSEEFAFRFCPPDNIQKSNKVGLTKDQNRELRKWNKIMFDFKSIKNFESHEDICRTIALLFKLLDNRCGMSGWTSSEGPASVGNNVKSSFSSFSFGLDFSYQTSRDVNKDLFAAIINACAWSIAPLAIDKGASGIGISFKGCAEILIRNSIHYNAQIANASVNALLKLASRKGAGELITIFGKVAFRLTEKPGPHYESDYFNSEEFLRLLRIYVELLRCWSMQFSQEAEDFLAQQDNELMNSDVLNDLYQINYKAPDLTNLEIPTTKWKPYEELEWKNIVTVVEEVEGNGLFFLCSQDSRVRSLALSILRIVEQFDQSLYHFTDRKKEPSPSSGGTMKGHSRNSSKYVADEGTRLIHVLEEVDLMSLLKPLKRDLSVPERTRLSKIKAKKGLLTKFASSDHGVDSTIWFRIYPKLLDIFFERCPMPVAMCRSIVCVRLVQMHELVLEFSENYKNYTSSLFSRSSTSTPPEVLINQWKLYLIFACCSLTSTNDQKISFPSQPTHGHKKSLTMYIQHQKITSAKSVFRMVLPLLSSLQPMIRDAVIAGLSSININIFKTLAENLPDSMNEWEPDNHKRDISEDRVRIEIVHILSIITSRFKSNNILYDDETTVSNLVSIIKNGKVFLSAPFVQTSPDFQRLRCYFAALLENVFLGLKEKSDLDNWLPFEARIGCFNYLKEWCGYGDSKDILEERTQVMISFAKQFKEPATAIGLLEIDIKALQIASLSCMATLCSGALKQSLVVPGKTAVLSFDIKSVMNWVHEIILSDNERVLEMGKSALKNIMDININNDDIYQEVLRQCYNPGNSAKVKEVYYTNLVYAFLKHRKIESMPHDIFCLSTFLVGTDSYSTRVSAIELLKSMESRFLKTTTADYFTESVCCTTMVVYKKVLFEISVKLASLHSKDAFTFISFLTKYFNLVGNSTRRDILACLLPWVQTVELKYKSKEEETLSEPQTQSQPFNNEIDAPSLMVLNNLFEITVKFSKKISNEVEALWVALGTKQSNFDIIVEYIMRNCLERRNSSFVSYSRQIIAYLVYSQPDSSIIISRMIGNLQPKAMIPHPFSSAASRRADLVEGFPYTANLTELLSQNSKESAFSLGQLSMVFLVDLFRSNNEMIIPHLPLLLHVCFSLLDHYFYVVQEQAASLLIHLVHSIAPNTPKSIQTIEILRHKDHFKYLWVYDDLNNDKKGGITPRNMDSLVRKILEIFAPTVPNLQADWSRVSLKWATTCAVRHIACRSFQIFRSLLSFLDQAMLKDMLHRLSNTIADESSDIQGFAMQILMTLNAITAELDSESLIDFPQLFWSSVACLSTIHEHEFIETISTMSKFVSKIDLDAPDTISCLISTFPPKWEGRFEGLQQIVMVGLRSSVAWEPTIKFLDKLNHLKDSEIIGSGDHRLFVAIVANLPRFLHALEEQNITPEIEEACNLIGEMAALCNKPALARILNSVAKSKFRSKKDFLVQTISTIRTSFFPDYEAQTLVLLLSLLSNEIPWVKLETLNILKHTLPLVDLSKDDFVGVGADLISPLLRLLLTEYAEPALEVLDEAVVISGSQLDKDILRMSLGNSSMKKEYEQTATLFGIPESSGWAIPMPAVTAASTRNNIHAVFETCNESSTVEEKQKDFADEEIEFLMEDYYESEVDHADGASTVNEVPGATLSNMWAALDDFDSFFTKDTDQRSNLVSNMTTNGKNFSGRNVKQHAQSASIDTKESTSSDLTSPIDSAPHVYDKKALVILNRSLARTQSNTSFKSSLADNFGSPKVYGPQENSATRRSYIPFRSSRVAKKSDSLTTPTMNSATAFEQPPPNSAKTIKGSPSLSLQHTVSGGSQEGPIDIPKLESSTRLDNLLGGGRKKNRK
ncbi:hypothetical protein CJI97_000183 [Candidozyma auris]|nr:hypothetical protein CJI97_000183 [[Candida] auris]